jgi:hypothetical protein
MKRTRTSPLLFASLLAASGVLVAVELDAPLVTPAHAAKGTTKTSNKGGGKGGHSGTGSGTSTGTGGTTSTPPPAISSATVVLNAAQDQSDTGGSDLAAGRGLFRGASYPESNGGLQSTAALLDQIKESYSRTINAEDGSYLDGAGAFHASDRLNWNLPWMKQYGYNAHVIVGQKQPAFIPNPAYQWTQQDWATYADYAYKLVKYVAVQFDTTGFPETLFEVGNEIDITQDVRDLWTLANPAVPQGDDTRYQHYMRVYAVWANAVDRVARENPQRVVRIAGPALGPQSRFLSSTFWHERFVNDVAAAGLRLDALTLHFYGDVLNGYANVPGSSLRAVLQRMRQALVAQNRGSVPIYVTEYGPSEGSDAVFGHINYSHEGAAWAAVFLQEALAGTATAGSYLIVRDNFGASTTGSAPVASFTHIDNGVDYPKPAYNTFQMFTMLPGARKAVTLSSLQPDIRALGAADAGSAGLLVSNYKFRFNWPSDYTDLTVNETVVPGFVGLPFTGGATVDRYLIDAGTSNIARYIDNNLPLSLAGTSLTKVESCTAAVDTTGTLVLPARVLGPSAVSLWMVRAGAASGIATCQ